MADGARQDVLGQKAQAAQRAHDARGMSPAKAMRRALSRSADLLWDLALVTQGVTMESRDQDGVVDGLGRGDLLILLDGPDGAVGLAAIDRQVATGLIEVQTIQQVTSMPVDEDRVLTPTDAAMMAPLLNETISRLSAYLVDHPMHAQIEGYQFGAMIEDSRAASLLLDDASYRVFRAEIDLCLGRRKGVLSLVLPEITRRKTGAGQTAEAPGPGPYEDLLSRVPARLDVVLTRIRIPLSKAGNLKPGDLLPIPLDALDKVEVTAGRGQLVARGRLGQLNGARAVRLNWPSMPRAQMAGAAPGGFAAAGAGGMAADMAADLAMEKAPRGQPDALPDLPMLAQPAAAPSPEAEALPELPDLDFQSDASDFDFDGLMAEGEDSAQGDFSAAPVEFDFNE